MIRTLHLTLGVVLSLLALVRSSVAAPRRDERGLSQSTENAILLAGAVAVAGIVIAAITAFVQSNMPQ